MNRWASRLTPEQRAEVKARVSTWPKLTEQQREQVRTLFDGHDFTNEQAAAPSCITGSAANGFTREETR
jgi:Spy/CpxP family protein refolding chaperone